MQNIIGRPGLPQKFCTSSCLSKSVGRTLCFCYVLRADEIAMLWSKAGFTLKGVYTAPPTYRSDEVTAYTSFFLFTWRGKFSYRGNYSFIRSPLKPIREREKQLPNFFLSKIKRIKIEGLKQSHRRRLKRSRSTPSDRTFSLFSFRCFCFS